MKWNRLLLLALCATIAFGGTFVCKSSNDDGDGVVVIHSKKPTSR
jgi:hypothetical protein